LSEELVNRTVARMQADSVRFAQNEVLRGEQRLKDIRAKLTEFRNQSGIIDPASSIVASNSQLAQSLRANVSQLEMQLKAMLAQNLSLTSPAVMVLQSQIKAAKDQLVVVEKTVSQNTHGT